MLLDASMKVYPRGTRILGEFVRKNSTATSGSSRKVMSQGCPNHLGQATGPYLHDISAGLPHRYANNVRRVFSLERRLHGQSTICYLPRNRICNADCDGRRHSLPINSYPATACSKHVQHYDLEVTYHRPIRDVALLSRKRFASLHMLRWRDRESFPLPLRRLTSNLRPPVC